jgi:SP family facilitated glucose transporter-like MFS transporter 3
MHPAGSPLLPEARDGHHVENQLTLRELLSNSSMRGPTLLCAAILALQQLCGVNAVMFYSAPVLKPLLPSLAGAIGIGITFINALMTVVAIFLVDVSTSCYHPPRY